MTQSGGKHVIATIWNGLVEVTDWIQDFSMKVQARVGCSRFEYPARTFAGRAKENTGGIRNLSFSVTLIVKRETHLFSIRFGCELAKVAPLIYIQSSHITRPVGGLIRVGRIVPGAQIPDITSTMVGDVV